MSNLREAIKNIIWAVDAKFDDTRPTMDADYYADQINALYLATLPEKKEDAHKGNIELGHMQGWNDCIDKFIANMEEK